MARAYLADLSEGFSAKGLTESRDYVIEGRYAVGHYDRFPDLARELVQAGARMILPTTIAGVRAAQALNPPIPVVMAAINDPVGTGLIASLAHPGGYTTGVATLNEDLTPKILEFLRAILPKASTLAVISNPANSSNTLMLDNFRTRAGALGMTVTSVTVRSPEELDPALAALNSSKPDALHLISDAANIDLGDRISAFAMGHKLPFFSTYPEMVDLNGLLAYGPPRRKLLVRVGDYVKRILDGASPADLPVEQPTGIELWLNLKTASALGLSMPPTLLAIADKVIE